MPVDVADPSTPVSPKVKATATAGAVASVVLAIIALVSPETEVDGQALAAVVAGLMTAGLTLAGYLKRDPLRRGTTPGEVVVRIEGTTDPAEIARQVSRHLHP